MISERIIPQLLLKGSRLVKGTNFRDFTDVGDPVSQAMIYDAQGADEIIIVDVEASGKERTINTKIVNDIISRCRLPLAAGGGIKNVDDARKCFGAGADKIVVNTYAVLNPILVRELADEFGSQSVVVSVDVKKNKSENYDLYIYSGTKKVDAKLEKFLDQVIEYGAGEIVLTSIDREGTLSGYDYELYARLGENMPIPFIASGGAGCYDHIVRLFRETSCDGCTVGKMLFLRDYDIVRIKSYLKGKMVLVRDA
jgi:cyclase